MHSELRLKRETYISMKKNSKKIFRLIISALALVSLILYLTGLAPIWRSVLVSLLSGVVTFGLLKVLYAISLRNRESGPNSKMVIGMIFLAGFAAYATFDHQMTTTVHMLRTTSPSAAMVIVDNYAFIQRIPELKDSKGKPSSSFYKQWIARQSFSRHKGPFKVEGYFPWVIKIECGSDTIIYRKFRSMSINGDARTLSAKLSRGTQVIYIGDQ